MSTKAINIIFDGPPVNESGRFIEVETDDGVSINCGEWIDKGNGIHALRITELPEKEEAELGPIASWVIPSLSAVLGAVIYWVFLS